MNTEKKTFAPAEVEIVKFEKTDVIATSGYDTAIGYQPNEPIPEDD